MKTIFGKRQHPAESRREFVSGLIAAATAGVFAGSANAASYPNKPIRLIVGFAPGGAVDTVARALAVPLSRILNQSVLIDNKPGASGIIAAQSFLQAPADGYTLLMGLFTYAVLPHVQKLSFDPRSDLIPISHMTSAPVALVSSGAKPYKSFQDLIATIKKSPDSVTFGTGGLGTTSHLAGEALAKQLGVKITFAHFKGGAPALQSVIAGDVDAMFDNPQPSTFSFQKSGQLRVLAVMQDKRVAMLPDVPTITELGLPASVSVTAWHGLFGRTGTEPRIIQQISSAMNKALTDPATVAKLASLGVVVVNGGPNDFRLLFNQEFDRWGQLIKENGIKLD
jgi:tripartite-type tricarboxylate transporter receptor subunit TctC